MKTLTTLILVLFLGITSFGQDSYEKSLKEYLEACGTMGAFKPLVKQMIGQFKTTYTSVPDEFWDEFEKEFSTTSLDDLIKLLAPIYKKHLTEADIKEITKFYSTPVGKKLAARTPDISTESMQAGQVWGQAIGKKVMDKMKEKGY